MFLRRCDEELELSRELLGIDRHQAVRRLDRLRERIGERLEKIAPRSQAHVGSLDRRRLTADVIYSQLLFNDMQPARAVETAALAVRDIASMRATAIDGEAELWAALEMEAHYTHAVALALSGEIDLARQASDAAVQIAHESTSPVARNVISTHANIVLSSDPTAAVAILRDCLRTHSGDEVSADEGLVEVHLSMALVVTAYRAGIDRSAEARLMLTEARQRLTRVFTTCHRLGLYADAGAAALMRGIVAALDADIAEASWFAHAVAAAARSRQMETLWRSHINLA